jgi:hypothetical protein
MSHKKLRLDVNKMNDNKQIFFASRWTAGNLLFPVSIEVTKERVARIKRSFFSSNEESIAIPKVASVNIHTGIIWSSIRIDSTGGANPIVSNGHLKEDARTIRALIEKFQQ